METQKLPEEQIIDILRSRGWTITTAESCTGGSISARIIDIAGASDVLRMAFVTYCDEAKESLLGVRKETIEKYTAVSERTALEMAEGGAARAGAEVCLSATGIAGPGGTEEFPAGLVYIGCYVNGTAKAVKYRFAGSRNEVRKQAVEAALLLALEIL